MFDNFILPVSKASAKRYLRDAGIGLTKGFETLRLKGEIQLAPYAKLIWCKGRFNIVDFSSREGEGVVALAAPEEREMIPAAHNTDWREQKAGAAADLNESQRQASFKQRFLSL